jgi:hypothetical protein
VENLSHYRNLIGITTAINHIAEYAKWNTTGKGQRSLYQAMKFCKPETMAVWHHNLMLIFFLLTSLVGLFTPPDARE